jgi:hypothetical protein
MPMDTSRRHSNVESGSAEQGGKATYLVNDDGSGLRCAVRRLLVSTFPTLHSTTDFPLTVSD